MTSKAAPQRKEEQPLYSAECVAKVFQSTAVCRSKKHIYLRNDIQKTLLSKASEASNRVSKGNSKIKSLPGDNEAIAESRS